MANQPTGRDEALALVRKLLLAASQRDAVRVRECYARDATAVSPVFGEVRGRDAVAATWLTLFTTFTDLAIEEVNFLVDGDRVAVLAKVLTTDRTGWFGLPPTGSPITYRLVLLFTVEEGQIVRDERIYDSSGIVERLEKARVDKELRTAAEVQRTLSSRTAHRRSVCESVGDSVACRAIGGDFFEFFDLPSGDSGLLIGDVSGKGPAAALLAAMLQGMFAVEAPAGDGPAATLSRINRRLAARDLQARFATLVYAVLSPDGRLTYANAGHNAPVLAGRDGVRRLTTGGTILGAFADAAFEEETLQLQPEDMLVMFTDGVTEARSADDQEFGEDCLLEFVATGSGATPGELLNQVFAAVRAFAHGVDQSDDITVTVTRFR